MLSSLEGVAGRFQSQQTNFYEWRQQLRGSEKTMLGLGRLKMCPDSAIEMFLR